MNHTVACKYLPSFEYRNQIFYTITIAPDIELLHEIFNTANETINELFPESVNDLSWGFTFEPLPTAITQYGELKGGNSLGTTPEDGNSISKNFPGPLSSSPVKKKLLLYGNNP